MKLAICQSAANHNLIYTAVNSITSDLEATTAPPQILHSWLGSIIWFKVRLIHIIFNKIAWTTHLQKLLGGQDGSLKL